ncbi:MULTISPECIES: hypothetical protein [Cyanophyceae]|uniref:hypothetical protein n=1 Tax=Cyanophyceae TaxID=3028117 RepID=UPI001688B519|nr:hypothetical protein [Trichocoleus sp. FACHB-832]MBD1904263.1 hypothetical protein [Trichocoleus sp. FACHB-832]
MQLPKVLRRERRREQESVFLSVDTGAIAFWQDILKKERLVGMGIERWKTNRELYLKKWNPIHSPRMSNRRFGIQLRLLGKRS